MDHGIDAPPSHSKGGHHAQREHPPRTRDVPYMPRTDGRFRAARRWRTLYSELASTLADDPDAAERTLLVDAASLALESEQMAERAASGERVDPELRLKVSYALRDALRALGIRPRHQAQGPEPFDPQAHLEKISDPEHWRRKRDAQHR